MKTLTLLLAVAATSPAVLAQDRPTVVSAPAPAPAASPAAVRQFVYLAKLPTPAELISEAQAQGMTVSRIEQSDDRVTVVYQYADGSSQTYAYKLLSSAGGATASPAAPAPGPGAPAPVVESMTVVEGPPPPPRVVYVDEPETVYYTSPRYVRYYDPYWAPISFGINLGFRSGGYYSGGFRGGYHGGSHGGRRH